MKQALFKLPPNRVRRNYRGGAGIDKLHGLCQCVDTDRPEEWIGSLTEAVNPGLPTVPGEGLCRVETETGTRFLRDVLDDDPAFYLGKDVRPDGTWQLSFLFKILDSAMRLHVQVHPTTEFARHVLHKPYGKLECYYILSARVPHPYIRLGFQHAPTQEEWKRIVETQDIAAMDACFEPIPVRPGEVWYIPGGMPHAIGEGITMLEIMEPSDLVVRCEYEREGIVLPPEARFMQRGLDFCLPMFDYGQYTVEEITRRCRVKPRVLARTGSYEKVRLIEEPLTRCFTVDKYTVEDSSVLARGQSFTLGVVCAGRGCIQTGTERIHVGQGDSFALAAAADTLAVLPEDGTMTCVLVQPGPAMREEYHD